MTLNIHVINSISAGKVLNPHIYTPEEAEDIKLLSEVL